MHRILMIAATVLLTVSSVSAQRNADRPGRNEQNKMARELGLTAEQQERLKTIRRNARTEMEALRQENDERPDPAAVKQIREAAREAEAAVLTPAQRQLLEQRKAEQQARKRAAKTELRTHTREEVKPVVVAARARFDAELDATDRAAIDRLRNVFSSRIGQGRGEGTAEDREAGRAQAEAWRAAHAAEIAELNALTEKYAAAIDRVLAALEPSRKEWKRERRSIIRGEDAPRKTGPGRHPQRRAEKQGHRKDSGAKADGRRARQRFLLMKA